MRIRRDRVNRSCVALAGLGLVLAVTMPGCSRSATSDRSPKPKTSPETTAAGNTADATSSGGSGSALPTSDTSCRATGWSSATVTGDWTANVKFQPSCLSAGVTIETNPPIRSRPKYAFHFNDKDAGSIEVAWVGSEDGSVVVPTVGASYDSEAWRTSTSPGESHAEVRTARSGNIVDLGQPGTADGEYSLGAVVKFLTVPQRDGDVIKAEITLSLLKPEWTSQPHPPVIATRRMVFTGHAYVAWNVPH